MKEKISIQGKQKTVILYDFSEGGKLVSEKWITNHRSDFFTGIYEYPDDHTTRAWLITEDGERVTLTKVSHKENIRRELVKEQSENGLFYNLYKKIEYFDSSANVIKRYNIDYEAKKIWVEEYQFEYYDD